LKCISCKFFLPSERVIGRKSLPYEAVPTTVYRIYKIPKRFRQKGRTEGIKNKSLKFKIMDNIKESKEYQLAKDWERAVNDYGFNPKRFAAAIPEMHPTLQQSLYRLVKECIVVMADETRNYDDRNRASHEEAKCIMEYLKANGRHIPLR